MSWQQSGSDVVVQWAVEQEMFNGLITVEGVTHFAGCNVMASDQNGPIVDSYYTTKWLCCRYNTITSTGGLIAPDAVEQV